MNSNSRPMDHFDIVMLIIVGVVVIGYISTTLGLLMVAAATNSIVYGVVALALIVIPMGFFLRLELKKVK